MALLSLGCVHILVLVGLYCMFKVHEITD